ncbi:TPA: PD-(D/E)XK motif protein [Kluyvera ascorbata F0526]|nr:PD-(D/E)XK motif protein [Kluyvera ascorbata F0526]
MNKTYQEFLLLDALNGDGNFNSIKIDDFDSQFISKTTDGSPIFLIRQKDLPLYHPDGSFKYFNVTFNVKCIVYVDEHEPVQDFFCIIKFHEVNSELFEVFVRCISTGLSKFKGLMLVSEIDNLISQLVKLFRENSKPSEEKLIGLWGELFTIKKSKDINCAINAWHLENNYIYDFELENNKYEIKTTVGEKRIHNFSLRQLLGIEGQNIYIVSYLLQKMTNGTSILDLAQEIDLMVSDFKIKEKLWRNIFGVMGSDIVLSTTIAFDEAYANENTLYFHSDKIPKPIVYNQEISSVRFLCDLSNIEFVVDDLEIF